MYPSHLVLIDPLKNIALKRQQYVGEFIGQPQPSADPTPSQPVPTPSSSHVQITQTLSTPPPITQPPPTLTHSVQPPPQPSSVQPTATTPPTQPVETTSSPPISTIPDTQPTLPPSPQIPSPSYHDTEGPSFEPSYHMSPPPSHEPEIQASRSSEESEQLRNLMDIVPRLESRVESLEKELSETKQTLGTAILQLMEKMFPSQTDQGDTFATPEKSKGSGEAQEEQISPSTLEAAQILTNSQVNTGSTPSAQANTAEVNTAELNAVSTPSAQVNTAEVNTAALNTAEFKLQRNQKSSRAIMFRGSLKDLQAEMDAETQRQIDLDALLAKRLVEQEEEAAKEALATEFDYIQARLNADQIFAENFNKKERSNIH
ncbi:hypothetical protein Tco_0217675 [Tanacetum coccineum]